MQIRRSKIAHRTVRVGTVLAMAAGMVAVVATPSFAVAATLSQTKGPAAGTNKITVTGGSYASGASVLFTTAACPATYLAPTTGIVGAATVVVNTAAPTSLTVTVPALSSGTSYYVCSYANTTVGGAQTSATATAAYSAVAAGTLTVNPTSAVAGATVTGTDNSTAFGAGSTAVELNTASCPTTYTSTSATVINTNVGNVTGTSTVPFTVPTGLNQTVAYYVCAYTGTTTGSSALISGTSSAAFMLTPLTVSPAVGPAAGTNTVIATDAAATFTGSTVVEFNQTSCPATYTATSGTSIVAVTPTSNTTTTLTIVVPTLAVHTYFVCAYAGNSVGSSALQSGMAAAGYNAIAADTTLTPGATRGTPQGGAVISASDSTMQFGATTAVEFTTASCPAVYATPSSSVVAASATTTNPPALTMNITTPALSSGSWYICAYTGTTVGTSALMAATSSAAYGVFYILTLSATTGPTGGGNSITATTSGGTFISGQTALVFISPSTSVCPTTYPTLGTSAGASAIAVTSLRLLSSNKVALTVPATVTTTNGPDYNVCAYAGNSVGVSALVSGTNSAYTVAAAPTITSVSPAFGSTQGGTLITVTGTNLSTVTSATVAGVALQSVTPVSPTAFTAITPSHSAGGPFSIGAVTAGGPATFPGAFTYANGIVVNPNKASNSGSADLDIQGIGFSSLPFNPNAVTPNTNGSTPDDATAHVYLVEGQYDPTQTNATYKANGEVLECVNVLVISDTELVCTLYLAGDQPNRPAFAVAASPATVSMVAGSNIMTDSASGFTASDVGMTVTGTNVPPGATIVAVHSAAEAVLSANATGAVSGVSLAPPRNVANTSVTAGSTALVATSGTPFTAADQGRTITGTGIQPGTTIATYTDSTHITLSLPASGTNAGSVRIGNPAVPNGAYTITVVSDGSVGASGSTFFQSAVSGGSTFTVAGF